MNLSQATILITGGGRGIGNFIAIHLLGKVSKVIVIDHDLHLLNNLPESSSLITYHADITSPEVVEDIVREIFEKHGGINVCINNAGLIHSEPLVNILNR